MIEAEKEKYLTNCICCGSDALKPEFKWTKESRSSTMNKCASCGLLFQNPLPDEEELKTLYNNEYFHVYEEHFINFRTKQFNKDIKDIEGFKSSKGRLVDVGCAFGIFLNIAKKRGWEVFGVDVSNVAKITAKEKYGIDIFLGHLTQAGFRDQFFDVVTMWDVLEHVNDPKELIAEARRVLKPGGLLAIKTPNANELFLKIVKAAGYLSREKLAKIGPRFIHHMYLFSPKSIKILIEKEGFEIISLKTVSENLIIVDNPGLLNYVKAFFKAVVKTAELVSRNSRSSIVVYALKKNL